jgi:hypothetical protein
MASSANISSEPAVQLWMAPAAVDWHGEWNSWVALKGFFVFFHIRVTASWPNRPTLLAEANVLDTTP